MRESGESSCALCRRSAAGAVVAIAPGDAPTAAKTAALDLAEAASRDQFLPEPEREGSDVLEDIEPMVKAEHKLDKEWRDEASMRTWKVQCTNIFGKMMFVSGETAEPSVETTTLIEEIVRSQVIEMVGIANFRVD